MKTVRSGMLGLLAAFAVVAMVLGALFLGIQEGVPGQVASQTPRSTLPPPNLTPLALVSPFESVPPIIFPATPTLCPQPASWEPYTVLPGDDLSTLAESRGYSLEQILAGNCLISEMIIPNVLIFLPPALVQNPANPASSATPACQRPGGWIGYLVKRGDTLTRISTAYRVTVGVLKQVNCLLSDTILPGWTIWVPNVATSTFTASPSVTEKPTEPATATLTFTPTSISTATATSTRTSTTTLTPTEVEIPTLVPSPTVTSTPTPTTIFTNTPSPLPTTTLAPTITETPTLTPAP